MGRCVGGSRPRNGPTPVDVHPDAGAAGAPRELATAAGLGVGHRGRRQASIATTRKSSTSSGARSRSSAPPTRRARGVAARGGAQSRAPESPVDPDHVLLLGDASRSCSAARATCAAGSPAKRSGRASRARAPRISPSCSSVLRCVGSALSTYMHSAAPSTAASPPRPCWVTADGALWLLGWEWAIPRRPPDRTLAQSALHAGAARVADGVTGRPRPRAISGSSPPRASPRSRGEYPPRDLPPLTLVRPDIPVCVAKVLARALKRGSREIDFHSIAAMLRELDRAVGATRRCSRAGDGRATRAPARAKRRASAGRPADDYEVIAALGSGTFGSVWRVRDLSLEREVALKMLHPRRRARRARVHRFRREAQLAAQLAHPSIVPIYDWDSSGDVAWYTMELAEGGSLADLVARSGPAHDRRDRAADRSGARRPRRRARERHHPSRPEAREHSHRPLSSLAHRGLRRREGLRRGD